MISKETKAGGTMESDPAKTVYGSSTTDIMARPSRELPESLRNKTAAELTQMRQHLVRKVDIRLVVPLSIIYIMNFLDRNAIAAAKISGIEDDIRLSDSQFQLSVSILFVGYILMQVPSNLFLNKIGKPSLYLPGCMLIWGAISAATGAVKGFSGLMACRFMLGFIEAAYFPGCLLCLAGWYTRKELGLRTAMLYCGSLLSGAFSGLIAAGITQQMDGTLGLAAWRWLFIIEGAITAALAVLAVFILPDFPANTKWLSAEERDLATWRLVVDVGEEDWTSSEEESLLLGLKQCLVDSKIWPLVVLIFGSSSSGTINSYFPSVVATLGYGRTETLLLTTPPYILSCIVALLVCLSADRTGERYLHLTIPLWVSIVGFIISASAINLPARYFAMIIMLPGVYTAFTLGLTWIANTMPRPPAKRAAALAFCNACGHISSIYGPFLYPQRTAPRYLIAMGLNAGTALMAIIAATVLRFMLVRKNRMFDSIDSRSLENEDCADDGLKEQERNLATKGFRYLI